MHILSLKDENVQQLRAHHPALQSKKLVGRGVFGAVFEAADPSRVLKLTTDFKHINYLIDGRAPKGPYKPVVFEYFGPVGETSNGETLYLIEIERLHRLRRGTHNGRMAQRITRFFRKNDVFPERSKYLPDLTAEMAEFMYDLNCFFIRFSCAGDPGWSNFMERPDGTLVFSDPICDDRLLAQAQWKHHQQRMQ